MADINERLTQFCDYVQSVLNIPTLKMKRSMVPQMKKMFATVGFGSIEPVQHDRVDMVHQNEDNDLLKQVVRGLYQVEFIVQVFGKGALAKTARLRASFYTEPFVYWCDTHEFGFSGPSQVQDLSSVLLDSDYEERGQLTATFYVPCREEFEIDFFNSEHFTVIAKGEVIDERTVPEENQQ